MATENFVRDLAQYFQSGVATDLTLIFGDRTRQIHKALVCCHSKWFLKAMHGRSEKATSGVITLTDEDEFMDAIDCMVTYFYKAGYDSEEYCQSEALLHAQVAVIADKYDCESLFSLAKTSFANSVEDVDSEGWVDVASLVYNHTTAELQAHKDLRSLVISSISEHRVVWEKVVQTEKMIELLRLNKDLAIDLLRDEMIPRKRQDVGDCGFRCNRCLYMHIGPASCAVMAPYAHDEDPVCPWCGHDFAHAVVETKMHPCPHCDGGLHNYSP